jgi:hypothetical protein
VLPDIVLPSRGPVTKPCAAEKVLMRLKGKEIGVFIASDCHEKEISYFEQRWPERHTEDINTIPPATEFLKRAFANKNILNDLICDGLWLTAPA